MKIGVIGAGRIGGTVGTLLTKAGHEVFLSFSRDKSRLSALAADVGERAQSGEVRDAVQFGDIVILSVPWRLIPAVLRDAGSLEGKIVIDTNNQFGAAGLESIPGDLTAVQFNQNRMPGARLVKCFNTLTSGFLAAQAGREPADQRVVIFLSGDDGLAKELVSSLIADAGFAPADVGSLADAAIMEAPRREGAVYGEEYRPAEAQAVINALRIGQPIPPTPEYY
jgi:predicted dinucleotide-binding enzyme